MAKVKKAVEHLREHKKINVRLIPAVMSNEDFKDKKEEVQRLLVKMLINSHKRGRPSKEDGEDFAYAA